MKKCKLNAYWRFWKCQIIVKTMWTLFPNVKIRTLYFVLNVKLKFFMVPPNPPKESCVVVIKMRPWDPLEVHWAPFPSLNSSHPIQPLPCLRFFQQPCHNSWLSPGLCHPLPQVTAARGLPQWRRFLLQDPWHSRSISQHLLCRVAIIITALQHSRGDHMRS